MEFVRADADLRAEAKLEAVVEARAGIHHNRRGIDLIRGEALFDVTKDRKRPFVVTAGATQVRAVGTSFSVQLLPDQPVQVLVREGVVEIKRPDVPMAPPVRAAASCARQ